VNVQTVQNVLDNILPGLLPLGLKFLVTWMLRKGANPLIIILGIFVIGILGYWVGFLERIILL
jgi:PTS system fructose-specific IID component